LAQFPHLEAPTSSIWQLNFLDKWLAVGLSWLSVYMTS